MNLLYGMYLWYWLWTCVPLVGTDLQLIKLFWLGNYFDMKAAVCSMESQMRMHLTTHDKNRLLDIFSVVFSWPLRVLLAIIWPPHLLTLRFRLVFLTINQHKYRLCFLNLCKFWRRLTSRFDENMYFLIVRTQFTYFVQTVCFLGRL